MKRTTNFHNAFLLHWVVPFGLAVAVFVFFRPVFAQIAAPDVYLDTVVSEGTVRVGSETVRGYQQVYYLFNGKKRFITEGNQNSTQAVASKEHIAYSSAVNGAGQIFLYHIPSDTTVQITNSSTNLKPKVSNGNIVWEGWTPDKWQVFLFDGIAVRQLTSGELSINPDISGDQVVYAKKDAQDEWKTLLYTISTKQEQVIKTGLVARYPLFRNGEVVFELEEVQVLEQSETIEEHEEEKPEPTPEASPEPTPEVSLEPTPTTSPIISPEITPDVSPSPEPTPTPVATTSPLPSEPEEVTEEDIQKELESSPSPTPPA